MKRERQIKFRCNATELLTIKSKSNQAGMTPARYSRESALGNQITIRRMSKDEKEALMQLSRIGNNLNQLTRYFHEGQMMYTKLAKLINEIEKKLEEIL